MTQADASAINPNNKPPLKMGFEFIIKMLRRLYTKRITHGYLGKTCRFSDSSCGLSSYRAFS
jgi:hypothetical protein